MSILKTKHLLGLENVSKLDISKIIDKTENWLFDKEEDSGEKEINLDERI